MRSRRIKHLLLWIAKHLGLFWVARLLTRRSFAVIGWHGVSLSDEHLRMPKYFISEPVLRRRLAYLTKHYKIISLDEAVRQHAAGAIRPGQVVLTFDDGLYNFGARAAPLLKTFDCPATVYAISSTIMEPAVSHVMLVRDVLLLTNRDNAQCELQARALGADDDDEWATAISQDALRTMPAEESRAELLQRMAEEFEVDLDGLLRERVWQYLTAEELRELSSEGFDIQAHSHLHRTVCEFPDSVYEDTLLCKELLEETSGKPVQDYCYPSGSWERRTWAPLAAAGMRSAVTCQLGPNFAKTPPLALRRYIDSEGISQLEFESLVSGFRWLIHVLLHRRGLYEPSEPRADKMSLF